MVGFGNVVNIFGKELFLSAIDHGAYLPGIDKKGLPFPVPVAALVVGLLAPGEKPKANRGLRGEKELTGHGPVGQNKTRHTVFQGLGDHVGNPGIVGITGGRNLIAVPAGINGQFVGSPPGLHIEGRIGHDVIGLQIRVLILEEGVGRDVSQIDRKTANRLGHLGQLVGDGRVFLPVDRDIHGIPMVVLHKLQRLHKHPPRPKAGVVDDAFVRFDYFRNQIDHTLGGIEFTPQLTLGGGKFAQEIFIDPSENVLFLIPDCIDIVDRIDQGREFARIQAQAGEIGPATHP